MQNDIAITTLKLKSKPEVQYNTAAIPFPKPEVICLSRALRISSKFGIKIVIHRLKLVQSLYLNPKVDF